MGAGWASRGARDARGRARAAPTSGHRRLSLQGGRRGLSHRRVAHPPVPAGCRERRLRRRSRPTRARRLAPGVLSRRTAARLSRQLVPRAPAPGATNLPHGSPSPARCRGCCCRHGHRTSTGCPSAPTARALGFLQGEALSYNAYIDDRLALADAGVRRRARADRRRWIAASTRRASPRGGAVMFAVEDDGRQYPAQVDAPRRRDRALAVAMVVQRARERRRSYRGARLQR